MHRKSIRLNTTGWEKWSTGNCTKKLNLTLRSNVTCSTQHLHRRMTCTNSSRIFEIQTDHLPDLMIVKNKRELAELRNLLSRLIRDYNWKKAKRRIRSLTSQVNCYTNCRWCSWYSDQRIGKMTRGLGNKSLSGDN